MSGHNTPYHMFQGPLLVDDPGNAGTIVIDRYGAIVPLVSATAETRTLAAPTKAGILASLVLDVDNGNVTMTVTGAYNHDGDLTIVFYDAGDYVSFMSVKVGSVYRWRVVGNEGAHVNSEQIQADKVISKDVTYKVSNLDSSGPGADGGTIETRTYRYTRDSTIITEIQIDLTGLASVATANDIIGLAAGGAAYLGRNVVATNGIIYKIEMSCLEVPATGDTDIDLVSGSAADDEYDEAVTGAAVEINGGTWAAGTTVESLVPAVAANYYYYLTTGAGATAGTYTSGQFLIRFFGHALIVA